MPQHRGVRGHFQRLIDVLPSGGPARLPRFHPIDSLAANKRATSAAAAAAGASTSRPVTAAAAAPDPPPPPVPPHISLSRTVAVRLEQSKPLLASLGRALRASGARGRMLTLGPAVAAFANDERTRTFAALPVRAEGGGAGEVVRLIRAVDEAFAEHGLRTFYDDPMPHASFAWALGDHVAALEAALADGDAGDGAGAGMGAAALEAPLAQVVCRIGQRETVVWTAPLARS